MPVSLPDARIIPDKLAHKEPAAKSDQLGYLNRRFTQNRKEAILRILFQPAKVFIDFGLLRKDMSARMRFHGPILANGILAQAVKLLIDRPEVQTPVQTEQNDRIPTILAIQLVYPGAAQKPIRLPEGELHGEGELENLVARRHPAAGENLIAERLIEIRRPDDLAPHKTLLLKQPVKAGRKRAGSDSVFLYEADRIRSAQQLRQKLLSQRLLHCAPRFSRSDDETSLDLYAEGGPRKSMQSQV
mgnify:CR=1 FL=1